MPIAKNNANPYKLGEYTRPDRPGAEDEKCDYFPKNGWKTILALCYAHDRFCASFEHFMNLNPRQEKALANMRCEIYRFLCGWYVQVPKINRNTGEKVCPSVCVKSETTQGRKSRRVPRIPGGA